MAQLPPIKRGDTKTYTLNFAKGGVEIDISGDAFHFVMKRSKAESDAQAAINHRSTFPSSVDSVAGKGSFTLSSIDTDVPVGEYYYGMQKVTAGSPPIVTSLASGMVKVEQDIAIENG